MSSSCCPDHFGFALFKSVKVLMWFSSPVKLWCHFSADPKTSRVRLRNTTHGGEWGTCRLSLFVFLLRNWVSAVCFTGSGVCQECWIGIRKLKQSKGAQLCKQWIFMFFWILGFLVMAQVLCWLTFGIFWWHNWSPFFPVLMEGGVRRILAYWC